MNICFLLPGYSRVPIGGYKLVYQYAVALKKSGYGVTIVHVEHSKMFPGHTNSKVSVIKQFIKKMLIEIGLINSASINWFKLGDVKSIFLTKFTKEDIPNADVYVATSWQTALMINELRHVKKSKKYFYFIQGYETWDTAKDKVDNSWKLPIKKLVISKYLEDIANQLNVSVKLVPNFLDHNEYYLEKSIEKRNKFRILIMYHPNKNKNFDLTVKIINKLNIIYDNKIIVDCFSAYKKNDDVPGNYNFHYRPNIKELRSLYNQASIFLSTSLSEGWGMTCMEAMACGCLVVALDNGGINNYATSEKNAFICKNSKEIIEKILLAMSKDSIRLNMVNNSLENMQKFSLKSSMNKMVEAFEE